MGFRSIRVTTVWVAVFVLLGACAHSTHVVENDEHPFPEAMFATVSSLAYQARDPEFSNSLRVYRVRTREFRNALPVWYWKRPDSQLTFVFLAGYGGNPESTVFQAIAEQLWSAGFSVLGLPSSTHDAFALAASGQRLPGHMPRDLVELGTALDQVRDALTTLDPTLKHTRWALAGISYGALQTLQEAQSLRPHSTLNFDAFLAFNPPVRLSYAMDRLDSSFAKGATRLLSPKGELDARLASKIAAASEGRLYWSETLAAFTQDELEFLLAWDFRKALLKAISWPQEDPQSLSFSDYIRTVLLPSLSPQVRYEDWSEFHDLRYPENATQSRPYRRSVLVFHSLNDPLSEAGDLHWLKHKLGPQMQLYRHGGHLGYVWSERFRRDLHQSLLPLHGSARD
jgi:hypothetical protein